MKYLPAEDITYKTKLSPEEVAERLKDNTAAPKTTFQAATKPYQGAIGERSFAMTKIVKEKNAFLPLIKGQIKESDEGAVVSVKMRLHSVSFIFIAIWCGLVGLAFVVMMMSSVVLQKFNPVALVPGGMFIIAWGMTLIGFKKESRSSIADLGKILEAE